jgi:hypothetical protein
MGYKLLGFAVWQGGKWYVRHRTTGLARKAAIGSVAALVVGGAIVAQRQQASSH